MVDRTIKFRLLVHFLLFFLIMFNRLLVCFLLFLNYFQKASGVIMFKRLLVCFG